MPQVSNVKFHFRAMTKNSLDLLVQGEGDPDAFERNLARVMDEQGFVRQDCQVAVWYQANGKYHEFLAISIKGPGADRSYYYPSREIVIDLIRARQESAKLNYVVQISHGWLGDSALKTPAG